MSARYIGPDGATYAVVTWHGEGASLFYVVREDADDGETVATYRERWRAERHAITGCGCAMGAHYYGNGETGCARKGGTT